MSELDRDLLDRTGLSANKVAELIGKSRQAVSKGIAGERDYLVGQDLKGLAAAVRQRYPDKRHALEAAIKDMFDTLSERVAGGGRAADLSSAIDIAERIWLVLPRFGASQVAQPEAYEQLFQAINARAPAARGGVGGSEQLEVTVFCDRARTLIERRFDPSWFDEPHVYLIDCDAVDRMQQTVIIDQHIEGKSACFSLVLSGFAPIEPNEAEAVIHNFADHVSDKAREADPTRSGRPMDAQHASVAEFSAAGLKKI